ncbi:MAG: hypothetical protein DI617_03445 [Streptococcus pyogenes]|nr:MAG: hypothetical protein DI617_03445 [Streptococcus pyogenes]
MVDKNLFKFDEERLKERVREAFGLKSPSEVVKENLSRDDDPFGLRCGFFTGADPVKKPSHYQGRYGMEAIDVVKNFGVCPEYEQGFYWGNALKYLLRWHSKNGIQDLKKARQNLDWLIENLEGKDDD